MNASTPVAPPASKPRAEIRFRPFEERDFDQILAWVPDEDFLLQWAGINFTWPLDRAQLERYLEESRPAVPGAEPFRIVWSVDAADGRLVGHIGIRDIDRRNDNATLSCVLVGDPAARSGGVGRAMVAEAVRRGFEDLGLHRIQLSVFDFNTGGIRCYEKAGFVREGMFREYRKIRDEYWNVIQMAILRSEWLAHQE